jgi:molybdate transport system substrate-binding protein
MNPIAQRLLRTRSSHLGCLWHGPISLPGGRPGSFMVRSFGAIRSLAVFALQPRRTGAGHVSAALSAVPKSFLKTHKFALLATGGLLAKAPAGWGFSITQIPGGGSPQRGGLLRHCWRLALSYAFSTLLLAPPTTHAQTLRIAAASDLQFAMDDLASGYQQQTAGKLSLIYGSSGNFYAQIQNGAPFDLFFSADVDYAQKLVDTQLGDPDSLFVYARGQLVLWAPSDVHLNLSQTGFAALRDPRVQKIALANPDHAPYGRAAVAALRRAGVYDQLKSKLVFGENISQAAQFAQSGSAQVGILALSLVLSPNMQSGDHWLIPSDLYPSIDQAAVLLTVSPNKAAARAFLAYVKSDTAREVLSRHGFTLSKSPPGPAKQKP